jgi:hypothetical protein
MQYKNNKVVSIYRALLSQIRYAIKEKNLAKNYAWNVTKLIVDLTLTKNRLHIGL